MKSDYFYTIKKGQGGDFILWAAEIFPIFIWFILINKYYFYVRQESIISKCIVLIPVIAVIINVTMGYFDKGISVPLAWTKGCLEKKEDKDGLLGFLDFKCWSNDSIAVRGLAHGLSNRFFYINYILFFIILLIQDYYADIWKSQHHTTLINLLCISSVFGIIGSTIPLFTGSHLYTVIALKFFSTVLWMSITMLILFFLHLYRYVSE